jgi:type I restriction enzyme S subunit
LLTGFEDFKCADDTAGNSFGGNSGSRIRVGSEQKISSSAGSLGGNLNNNDRFGSAIADIGDVNGPRVGDLLYSREGTYFGTTAEVPPDTRICLGQRMVLLRPNPEKAEAPFVRHWLNSPGIQSYIHGHRDGSVAERLNLPTIRRLPICLPSLAEQRTIAHILGTLDDKIELNRRMSETLEAMARALFKSWFVDFDPVRAKMEGRARQDGARSGQPRKPLNVASDLPWPGAETGAGAEGDPGLLKHIGDLCPDRLVDSELGEIPKGWEVKPIGDIVQVVGGSTPSTKVPAYWDGEYCWTTPKDLSSLSSPVLLDTQGRITEEGLKKITSGLLPINALLLSSRAPVGDLAIAKVPVAVNQGYIAIPPENPLGSLFLLYWCEVNMERIKERAGGTTFQEISKTNFRPILLVVPPSKVTAQFESLVAPAFERIVANERESRTLAILRGTLLPKLISGKLRISDVANNLENAV